MSVEGGSVGGSVAGAASVSGAAILGPSFEAAPVVVNEGPVPLSALENTMTIAKFNPIGEIAFKPSAPSVIEQAEKVAAAAWEVPQSTIAQAQKPALDQQETVIVPNVIPAWMPDHLTQPQPQVEPIILPITSTIVEDNVFLAVNPLLESVAKTELSPKLETRVSHQKSLALSPQSLPQEQEVEEEVLVENRIKEESEVLEEEEIEEIELKDLLDEKVIEQREYDLGKATDFAVEEAEKEGVSGIEGWRIVKFVRLHTGLLSQIAKKLGRDGSLDETIEELAAKQFRSKEEAKKQLKVIVSRNEPVKKGINGTPVQEGAAAKVLKYELDKGSPSEQVAVRMEKKKKVQVNKGQASTPLVFVETLENREPDLKTLSPELAEVFEKAA